jgi:hypothetical protein
MPGVMIFHAFGKQAFATPLPAPGQNGSSALGFHPCTKAMLAFAGPFRWLVSSFHAAARKGTAKVEVKVLLSMKTTGCHGQVFL